LERHPRLGRKPAPPAAPLGLPMDRPIVYEIRIEGHLADRWSDWFEGLAIRNDPNGETILSGRIIDQSALFGVLNKIHALNLTLIAVCRISPEK
jgi:hypothetical protein